jgi:predicted metalloprotease with PDZ domain
MIHYKLDFGERTRQLVRVHLNGDELKGNIRLDLPKWRPGRYILQNFAQWITEVEAKGANGGPVQVRKINSNSWEVLAAEGEPFSVSYLFYANTLDAGGSYVDDQWLYLNGINCLMYPEGLEATPCELELDIPAEQPVACGLKRKGNRFLAGSYHDLVDAPLLAGKPLVHHSYQVGEIPFHLWFLGECKPDIGRIETCFSAFSDAQIRLFGDFPESEFHFLFLIRPNHFRHGVEHRNSTVIAIGPGLELMEPQHFSSFLEISSHELFHVWNVKHTRPEDMLPYDYSRENFSELHYITEGITTYYGDLMLWKSGLWDFSRWLESINSELRTFLSNGGKDFISLETASFESWNTGYGNEGIPNRKISFYNKGYLVALMLDLEIRLASSNARSLDDVIRALYISFGKEKRGYTAADFRRLAEENAGKDLTAFFDAYISGTDPIQPGLEPIAAFLGLEWEMPEWESLSEQRFGFVLKTTAKGVFVENVLPDSPAGNAGLLPGDELISLCGRRIGRKPDVTFRYFADKEEMEIYFFRLDQLRHCRLANIPGFTHTLYRLQSSDRLTEGQLRHRAAWKMLPPAV